MTDVKKLKELIDETESLISKSVTSYTPEFIAWHDKAERLLQKSYGADSVELQQFHKIVFAPRVYVDSNQCVQKCKTGLQAAELNLTSYLEEVPDENGEMVQSNNIVNFKKVFIVHGHDSALKESVARVVEKQGIEVIILSEQVNQGNTIVEKFEKCSDVGSAICLFTADDTGKERNADEEAFRARQNVIFETGFFMGKLGRNHVIILADSNVEMPSDLSGVVYTNSDHWQFELLKELYAIGYSIDMNKLLLE